MPCPRYDFHTHTAYLGCANETMEVAAIVRECERLGVKALGITDHLNHLNQMELHAPILADIRALDTPVAVYFGVELNYTACDGPFAFNEEVKEACGFQFAIGGIHATYVDEYDPRKIIDIQHRHHLKTCADPLVQVLVHPYWFSEGEFKQRGWPLDEWIGWIPESHARELAQAARDSGTAIEINATANLTNPHYPADLVERYVDYLGVMAEEGPLFSVGSDAHDIGRLSEIEAAWRVVERLGLSDDRIWRPEGTPVSAAQGSRQNP